MPRTPRRRTLVALAVALAVTLVAAQAAMGDHRPDYGDWQYGMFERMDDGSFGGMWAGAGSEMHTMCVSCHVGAAGNDYAFLTYTGN